MLLLEGQRILGLFEFIRMVPESHRDAHDRDTIWKLVFLIAVAVVALIGFAPARQMWLINAWSLQYIHYAFNSVVNQPMFEPPPNRHARALLWLASVALKSDNPARAETLIAAQAAQGDKFALALMADALLAQDDVVGALTIWQQIKDVRTLLKVASQLALAGRLEEAFMAYEAAWTLNADQGALPLVNFLLNYRQDYDRAENILRQSLVTFPDSKRQLDWSRRLGDVLQAQKRWDEATMVYESIIAQAPDDWASYIGLGWTRYEYGGGAQRAIDQFQRAIAIDQARGDGYFAIAQVLAREQRFMEADDWYRLALERNQKREWYVARANAARSAGNLDLALATCQEAVEKFPAYAALYYEMALTYRLNEQPKEAIASIEKAIRLMPQPNAAYYVRAGQIYEWSGDATRALEAYRNALTINPENSAAQQGVRRLGEP